MSTSGRFVITTLSLANNQSVPREIARASREAVTFALPSPFTRSSCVNWELARRPPRDPKDKLGQERCSYELLIENAKIRADQKITFLRFCISGYCHFWHDRLSKVDWRSGEAWQVLRKCESVIGSDKLRGILAAPVPVSSTKTEYACSPLFVARMKLIWEENELRDTLFGGRLSVICLRLITPFKF